MAEVNRVSLVRGLLWDEALQLLGLVHRAIALSRWVALKLRCAFFSLVQLIEEIEGAGPRGPSFSTLNAFLTTAREGRLRLSGEVAKYGLLALDRYRSRFTA